MGKFTAAAAEKNAVVKKSKNGNKSLQKAMGTAIMTVYHLRKVIMALPVLYYAFKIALYNEKHLPVEVGLFLQNNGEFLQMIDRNTAVLGPLLLTMGCLVLMLFSRKAMYTWAISIFSLALPLLLLVSNVYPT